MMPKKIVLIGPESTGKSTLCKQLANHYHTLWCPEYAREYLSLHGTKYDYDDLLEIAKGQVEAEEKYIQLVSKKNLPLFIDTNMYVMKAWAEFVFGKCHPFILEQIKKRKYDLYLLCNIDLEWVKDELREYPELEIRRKLYGLYRNMMMDQNVPWVEISGNKEQ